MSARIPSTPPLLDGYQYVELLGSGGFADVFKYQQLRPRRDVAIKVLLRGLGTDAQEQFEAEANVMAMLSSHPSIVSIFAAGVAPDGRPYLVMENCQSRHLGARIKQKPLTVGRALEVAIQVAGAVETAHRLGILHRDIKPANILFTDFGRPALTDFGISVTEGGQSAAAFSVAWAPPEQIDNRAMGPQGDVYSLAATTWAMLVGRSPFDVPGNNNSLAVTTRAKTMPVPTTGRVGVPESLERILRTAMAKSPEQRYSSALEFARALQGVQAELHESVTTIDVRDDRADDSDVDESDTGTRVTGFALIDPEVDSSSTASGWVDLHDSRGTRQTGFSRDVTEDPTTVPTAAVLMHGRGSKQAHEPLEFTGPAVPQVPEDDTQLAGRPTPGAVSAPVSGEPKRRSILPLVALGVVLLAVAVLVAVGVLSGRGGASVATTTPTTTSKPKDPIAGVRAPQDVKGVVQGAQVVFTWTNPEPKPGDTFNYRPVLVDKETPMIMTKDLTATVPVQPGKTCIELELVRSTGQPSDLVKACAP